MSHPIGYSRNPDVAWRCIEGQAVLVHNRLGEILVLNDTGTFIWEHLDLDAASLARNMAEAYEVPEDEARKDVLEFLGVLRSSGAIVDAEP